MDMDYKSIEQLIERYWRCDTTLEEEKLLRDFFTFEEVPQHLVRYRDLFVYQTIQRDTELDEDFDTRIFEAISNPTVRIKPVLDRKWFVPLLRAVAIVFIVAFIGNVAQDIFQTDHPNYNYESYTDTYDNPEAAYQQVSSALLIVSEGINRSKELLRGDSVESPNLEEVRE